MQFILSKVLSFRDGKKKTSACQYGFVTFRNANPTGRDRHQATPKKACFLPKGEGSLRESFKKPRPSMKVMVTLPQTNSSPPFQMLLLLCVLSTRSPPLLNQNSFHNDLAKSTISLVKSIRTIVKSIKDYKNHVKTTRILMKSILTHSKSMINLVRP